MVKKIKKRIKKKERHNHHGSGMSFNESLAQLKTIYGGYSLRDISSSIFISSLWLPNGSSPIKHQFMTCVLASMNPNKLNKADKVHSYEDFRLLIEAIYKVMPSFITVEDYIPEPDWGNIKFYFDNYSYKIFYGQELSNVYDYLSLFEMLHLPIDEDYQNLCNLSPKDDFTTCLRLQDDIISAIRQHANESDIERIEPGNIETPSPEFWTEAVHFINENQIIASCSDEFLGRYSIPLGDWDAVNLKEQHFYQKAFEGSNLPYYFISSDSNFYPVLPKRYSTVLIDKWGEIYKENESLIDKDNNLRLKISAKFNRYVKDRISSQFLHQLVGAAIDEAKPHDFVFDTGFISKDRLILIYIANPFTETSKLSEELDTLASKLAESLELINKKPLFLSLHLKEMNVKFGGEGLQPFVYLVVPQTSTQGASLAIPKEFPAELILLDQMLGIIDELTDVDELCTFIEYLEEYRSRISAPFISHLNFWGSFKDSFGTLEEGATEFTMISIDPHWGSSIRYKTLSDFWKIYPDIRYWKHPRSWEVHKETESRARLVSRGFMHFVLYCKIGATNVLINAPFDLMSYEQGRLSNFIMECIEDSLSNSVELIEGMDYFNTYHELQIMIFPKSLVNENDTLKHLRHLLPSKSLWLADYGKPTSNSYGIRIVIDDNRIYEAFENTKNRELEIELALEVINQLGLIVPTSPIESIARELEEKKSQKPRFKLLKGRLPATFPQLVNPYTPEAVHFKKAKKIIALEAKRCGFNEGYYQLDEAKSMLNSLIEAIVANFNSQVSSFAFETVIGYLITRIDALSHRYESDTKALSFSLEHDVDYDRHQDYAEKNKKFITMHWNYRYLIEKFVQITPTGTNKFTREEFQYLIAIIDWLHVFYSASDSIHYSINPVGMKVSQDLRVEVVHEDDILEKAEAFAEKEAKLKLGTLGNQEDSVASPRGIEEYVGELDNAFYSEFSFTYTHMLNFLDIQSNWAEAEPKCDVTAYYKASENEIVEKIKRIIPELNNDEIINIINFLTLKPSDVLYISGQADACSDLPVWEYKKRFARYNIRPLIKLNDNIIWGPYSTRKAGEIWAGNHYYGAMPIVFRSEKIQAVLDSEKALIEKALEDKAYEITKRFTSFAEQNVYLHKRDKDAGHPESLGDYDVLALLQDKNIIINIECKDVLPAFSSRDAKTLRETIFGKTNENRGQFNQILKREAYLNDNIIKIASILKWKLNETSLPEIRTVYVARRMYWWTEYPPDDITATFLQVNLLDKFIREL